MEFVESDDGQPFRRPPALDDRVWRHPSEMGAPPATAKLVSHRAVWVAAAAAAVGASVLSTALLLTFGGAVLTRGSSGPEATSVVTVPGAPAAAVEPVVAIAERLRPAIAQIKVQRDGERASGSAVIFRNEGLLLTNAHVVEGATSVQIVLSNGREVPAEVVAADPLTDVAVVRARGEPGLFPVANLGSAADLKVGQTAVAMGSPLALAGGPSVTVGVISALHRSIKTRTSPTTLFDMIQTDAPIASGSSGGALLDGNGRVIGITTAIAITDGGADGLGFATPIDLARSVADQLIATGKATHPWLGIDGTDLDGGIAHDLSVDGGAMVMAVKDEGPAAQAGISARDVILSMNGKRVGSMGALVVALRAHRPGDVVTVEVVRGKDRTTRRVTLAERPLNP
jgi:S1-C subfamily serine protease